MATSSAQLLRAYTPEYLPESDGEPMAETDKHRRQMIALLDCLDEYFRPRPDIYVTGNIFAYPPRDEHGERRPISPDIFVVRGIEKKDRRVYDMEVEGKAPDLVIELVSRSTMIEDLGNKRVIYASLGVREYFLFDPLGEAFPTPLRGFRLEGNDYLPMMGSRLHSEVLDLELVVEDGILRLYDPKTGERLRTYEESEADRRKSEAKAAKEAKARQAAETARQEAEAKAALEAKARERAEAEMARLREELARLQGRKG